MPYCHCKRRGEVRNYAKPPDVTLHIAVRIFWSFRHLTTYMIPANVNFIITHLQIGVSQIIILANFNVTTNHTGKSQCHNQPYWQISMSQPIILANLNATTNHTGKSHCHNQPYWQISISQPTLLANLNVTTNILANLNVKPTILANLNVTTNLTDKSKCQNQPYWQI